MTIGPRTSNSPSSAMRSCTFFSALPTVPILMASGGLTVPQHDSSDMPHTSHTGRPRARTNSSASRSIAPPPPRRAGGGDAPQSPGVARRAPGGGKPPPVEPQLGPPLAEHEPLGEAGLDGERPRQRRAVRTQPGGPLAHAERPGREPLLDP